MASMFLMINHKLTDAQVQDAKVSLGVDKFMPLPLRLGNIWKNIPATEPSIKSCLIPKQEWVLSKSCENDYCLIQGDFGACHIIINFAFDKSLIPIYSTTQRKAKEEEEPDGTIRLTHIFNHNIVRKYGG